MPVVKRIQFKNSKCLNGSAPRYLTRKYMPTTNSPINGRVHSGAGDRSRLFRVRHVNARLPGHSFLGMPAPSKAIIHCERSAFPQRKTRIVAPLPATCTHPQLQCTFCRRVARVVLPPCCLQVRFDLHGVTLTNR